jgi:hypothetical protein
MASETEIANLALSHLNIGKEIANLETEKSEEAGACRRFYDTARDETLRDFAWPFATKFVTLAPVADNPTTEWGKSYRYPSDCVFFRRILSGLRNDTRQSRVPYKVTQDAAGLLIFTDLADAVAEFTIRETDPSKYPSDFTMAFSMRLAALIAPRLTGGDPFKVGERAMRLYQIEIERARATAFNEQQNEEPPESEFIRARD